jgi:hypothetical protein
MTKRELEIRVYNQRVATRQAEQKAADVGYALDLFLNGKFRRFHKTITSDGATQEFLLGIATDALVTDPMHWLFTRSQTEDRRIVFWKTTWESGEQHASAYHESEFRLLPEKLRDESPELKKLLQEANEKLPIETEPSCHYKNTLHDCPTDRLVVQ